MNLLERIEHHLAVARKENAEFLELVSDMEVVN